LNGPEHPANRNNKRKSNDKMSIFRKQSDAAPNYSLDDLRRDIGVAIAKARDAHIHSVVIERACHAAGDAIAMRRVTTTAVI
jgi:hypothetical protein